MNWFRLLGIGGTVIAVVLIGGYLAFGAYIYNQIATIRPNCGNFAAARQAGALQNTPASFTMDFAADYFGTTINTSPYVMPAFEEVSFPARADGLSLSAWYVPSSNETEAPSVIVVHGLGSCKNSPDVMITSGMLARNGYNVLLLDLREHGASGIEDGKAAFGSEEYLDVLGAWDWLVNTKQQEPQRIGVLGFSMGGAAALIAAGEETQLQALWMDSVYTSVRDNAADTLERFGMPRFVTGATLLMGRLMTGDDVGTRTPRNAVSALDGRALYLLHGEADNTTKVNHTLGLAQIAGIEPWIIPGLDHTQALVRVADEYEQRLVAFFGENLESRETLNASR